MPNKPITNPTTAKTMNNVFEPPDVAGCSFIDQTDVGLDELIGGYPRIPDTRIRGFWEGEARSSVHRT
jgi:hypothetical protein